MSRLLMFPVLSCAIGCSDYTMHGTDEAIGWDTGRAPHPSTVIQTPPDNGYQAPLQPEILVDPVNLGFGETETSATLSFDVSSVGSDVLSVEALVPDDLPDAFEVIVLTELPVELAPGESFPVMVSYTAAAGSWSGGLLVESDDPGGTVRVEISAETNDCEEDSLGDFFVTPGPFDAQLQLVESHGDGSFADPWLVGEDVGETITDPLVADFDADGTLDVLGRGDDSDNLFFYTYDPCEGAFIASELGDTPPFRPLVTGDFNDDGQVDVAGWNENREGVTGLGRGDGSFAWIPGAFSTDEAWSGYAMILSSHAQDLTDDGVVDLVIVEYSGAASSPSGVHVAPGEGDGTFSEPVFIAELPQASNGVDVGDVDGDGWVDIVAGLDDDGDAGVLYMMAGGPSGMGEPITLMDIEPTAESGTNQPGQGSVYLTDWDLDGDLDLLSAHRPSSSFATVEVSLWLNDGDGDFGSPQAILDTSQMPSELYMAVPARP